MPISEDHSLDSCYLCNKHLDTDILCPDCEDDVEQAIAAEYRGNPQPIVEILDQMDARLHEELKQVWEEANAIGLDLGASTM